MMVGYSEKIGDPSFKRYVRNSNRFALIFAVVIACLAIVGFYVAGEMDLDGLENPESLYIGLVIGGMFLVIALFQILGRKLSRTWDGVVVDKRVEKKTRRSNGNSSSRRMRTYLQYHVVIKADHGRKHHIRVNNNSVYYDYFEVGDKVRHHGGLNSYEKYDKTGDTTIFCAACGTVNPSEDERCRRCKCPLLK